MRNKTVWIENKQDNNLYNFTSTSTAVENANTLSLNRVYEQGKLIILDFYGNLLCNLDFET